MRWRDAFAVAAVALSIASAASAQEQLPRGRWWRKPEVVRAIGLTEEQQRKLDVISRSALSDLIDVRASVEKAALGLRDVLDESQVDRERVQKAGAKLMDARARLFERELMMLVDIRGVLNPEQWTKVRHVVEREREARPRPAPDAPMTPGPPRQHPGARRPMAPTPDERNP